MDAPSPRVVEAPFASAARPRPLTWVLAHAPASVFAEPARQFCELIRRDTSGRLEVRVQTPTDAAASSPVAPQVLMGQLIQGSVEMIQGYTPLLAQYCHELWTLDLPFLFRDHAHAARALDGALGERLLAGLRRVGVRGLAFTYSGGYRVMASTRAEIRRPEDFAGLRVRTSYSPVALRWLEALGAVPVPCPADHAEALAARGDIDAAETTYPRYWALGQHETLRVVSETRHSLFLTAIAVNEGFFQSLSSEDRGAFAAAARRIAALERAQSIRDGEAARESALSAGVKIVPWDEAQTARLQALAQPLYEQFRPLFGADLVDALRRA